MTTNYFKTLIAATAAILLTGVIVLATDADNRVEPSAKQSYVFKTYLDKDSISIQSKDGVVTLKGTVTEESHISLAEETVANLPGVKKVNNQLKVKGKHHAKNSDGWIDMQVRFSLLFNRYVNGMGTQVSVHRGVVTLKGEAENDAQKELTSEYVKDINGVKEVKNEMTIVKKPQEENKTVGEMVDDASITSQVKAALFARTFGSLFTIGVSTSEGVVTLTGEANSGHAKDRAAKIANDVKGVKNVVNNMTIKG